MKLLFDQPPLGKIPPRISVSGIVLGFLALSSCAAGQAPEGFHWVDFRQETSTVSSVERALKSEQYTAIREVGVLNGFALVMTVQRDPSQSTPVGDVWRVYNLSMKTGSIQELLTGYNLEIKDWLSFQPQGSRDLGLLYLNCWECEPGNLFTAFHFETRTGWRARWTNDKDSNHPGITVGVTDVGDPYTNEDVDQVFAVLAPREGVATLGTWYYAKDLTTGKITESVSKFFVDQATGQDKSIDLVGSRATSWKIRLCNPADSVSGLFAGQSSSACKRIIRTKKSGTQ